MRALRQKVEVHEDDARIRTENALILAGNGYELKDQRTFHRRGHPDSQATAVVEHWEDTWWGFQFGIGRFIAGKRPRVRRLVMLAGNHGLPLEPRYGPRHGWRGPEPTLAEAVKMAEDLHEVANSEAAVEAFRKSAGSGLALNNATSIGALVMLIPTIALIGLVAMRVIAG